MPLRQIAESHIVQSRWQTLADVQEDVGRQTLQARCSGHYGLPKRGELTFAFSC